MEEDDVLSLSPDNYSTETIRQTRADRLRESATAPDFTPTKLQTTKDVLAESVMHLSDEEREDILRSTGVYASTGKQVSTAIENALIGMNQLPDELAISFGNISNYITGGAMGQELQNIAYDSMARRYERMANREEAIGGIRSELAQLAGGATSFLQLALEGLVTSGALPLAHIGVQSFGEGTYNDMKAYADKHNGSLEGYQPEGFDLAVNAANALLQVGIEHWLGVGSPRFLTGMSRGMWVEGLGGALQEGVQGALADLAEAAKGNEEIGILLDNADQYARDAIIGGLLQGAMGAATYHHNYAKAANNIAGAIAKAHGHETPTAEEQQQAEAIVDAKERQLGSVLTTEFKAAFDASTGEGKLQANIAKALNDAVAAQELDLGIDDETERAQRIEQIATQETLNAMDMAREQNRSISEMGMNNIVYRDGAIWLEGMTPEVGQRAVDYARVLAERQTGLAEVQMKLDNINAEIKQTKVELAEAKAQSKEAFVDKLQARLDKQNALAEKRKVQAEQLKAQTEKIQRQIAKELEKAPKQAETKVEEVKAVEEPQKTEAQVEIPESKVEVPEAKVESAPAKEEPKAEPKPMASIKENMQAYKGEKKSLAVERSGGYKLKVDGELVKVIEKPKGVDFSDAKVYEDKSTYLPKCSMVAKGDNIYIKMFGSRTFPTTYLVIENYKATDPGKIIQAQEDIDAGIGNHFEDMIKEFYLKNGLWSLNDGMRLKSIDESIAEDKAREEQQPETREFEAITGSLDTFDARGRMKKSVQNRILNVLTDEQKNKKITTSDGKTTTVGELLIDALSERVVKSKISFDQRKGGVFDDISDEQLDKIIRIARGIDETLTNEDLGFEKWQEGKTYQDNDIVILPYKGNPIGVREGDRWLVAESAPEAIRISNERKQLAKAQKEYEKKKAREKAAAQKKMEEDFLSDEGTVIIPMDYIIEKLKYYDMWDDLKLREKGNMNAIGSLVFQDGEIKRGHRNEKTKKGSTISQKTIDTVQEVRRRMKKVAQDIKVIGEAQARRANEYMEAQDAKKPHREQIIENMTNGSDRFLKIVIPVEGKSFIEANKDVLNKIDMFTQADFLQRAVANDKITPDMIGEIFDFVENMPQGNYLSNVYYDIMVKPTTPTDVALKAKDKYNRAMADSTTQEDWTNRTPSEVATEKIKTVFGVYQSEIKNYEKKGVLTDTDVEGQSDDLATLGQDLINKELIDYMFMKYNFDPRVVSWIRENPNLLRNNNDQRDAWEGTSGSDLVDVLGTEQDYAPEGLVREDDEGVTDDNYDYEMVVYKMPQTQEEFERKVAETIVKQATTALELEDSDAKTFVENDDRTPYLFQSKVEGTGSDTKRGGYDERLKRIILKDDADLTTIQHEFAHYWIQNNFKWARSGLASAEWLSRWRGVEEALGIEPQDRYLSKQASEKFARAYERYIMEGKVAEDLQWAFDGFQKFYQDTYEDLESEYFDLSEELDPAIVDWFNRQRPATEAQLKQNAYKKVATVAMAQGASIVTPVNENVSVVSNMNENGEIESQVITTDAETKDSRLAKFSDKKKARRTVEGLREINPDVKTDQYNVLNRAQTVEEAHNWIVRDRAGAWAALNDETTNPIDRAALFQAFKNEAENGDYALGAELAAIKFPKNVTELGQAISVLGERAEFDPLTIIEQKQKSLGEPTETEIASEIKEMGLDADLTDEDVNELKNSTECVL